MKPLTGKQNRFLRSIGQRLETDFTVGENGLTDAGTAQIKGLLNDRELIKVRLTTGHGAARKTAAQQIAEATEAHLAGVVGRTFLLYRPNPDLPQPQRLALPDS